MARVLAFNFEDPWGYQFYPRRNPTPLVSGGATYNVSIAEAVTAADTLDATVAPLACFVTKARMRDDGIAIEAFFTDGAAVSIITNEIAAKARMRDDGIATEAPISNGPGAAISKFC